MEKTSKIFIAGARGLVGSALVRELRAQGYNNLLTPLHAEVDFEDPIATRWYFSVHRPEVVFLCAARVGGIADNAARKVDFLVDNLHIELNLISNAATFDCRKLVFVSTSCCYPRDCPQPMKPADLWTGRLEPTTEAYSVAKLAGMKLCQYYKEQHGKNFVSALPCNLFGERDNFDMGTAHALPGLMARLHAAKIAGDPFCEIWGSGKQQREFLHASDLARGLIRVMEHYDGNDPINIGSGLELSIAQLAILIAATVGYGGRLAFNPNMPEGTPRKILDSSVIRALGWAPELPFLRALNTAYEWYLVNTSPK
jgi:GDP-L-fucose synthase